MCVERACPTFDLTRQWLFQLSGLTSTFPKPTSPFQVSQFRKPTTTNSPLLRLKGAARKIHLTLQRGAEETPALVMGGSEYSLGNPEVHFKWFNVTRRTQPRSLRRIMGSKELSDSENVCWRNKKSHRGSKQNVTQSKLFPDIRWQLSPCAFHQVSGR